MAKKPSLADTVMQAVSGKPAPKANRSAPAVPVNDDAPRPVKVAARDGKISITVWVEPSYKTSLRAIQVKAPERQFQDLFTEALNDLFAKYNVPVVSTEVPRAGAKRRA